MRRRLWRMAAVAWLGIAVAAAAQRADDRNGPAASPVAEPMNVVVIGRRLSEGPTPARVPPRCVKRPGDPADLVPVHAVKTGQRVIAPDRNGVLTWQRDRDPVLGPAVWQRAGTGIGQYVFRVPDDGLPMCIGAKDGTPSGWGQLRRIETVTTAMVGKYLHFSGLIAARDASEVRFWLVAAANGPRVIGGDTHTVPQKGTFGWKQVDVVVGPVPREADHVSYGVLLWGKGDVWIAEPKLAFRTRAEVRDIPSLPTTLRPDPAER